MPHSRKVTTAEAYMLAAIGGGIDAIGVLTLGGLFVSHMSGNTAALGAFFGQGDWSSGWPHLFAIPVFVLGLFLGYLCMATTPSYRRCAAVLLAEAVLLAIFSTGLLIAGSLPINTPGYFLLATPALLAMGMQNATLRQIGRSVFASTYVTGVLDALAKSAAELCKLRGRPEAAQKLTDTLSAAGVWLCYALGAVAGSAGLLVIHHAVTIIPVVILLGMAWQFYREHDASP